MNVSFNKNGILNVSGIQTIAPTLDMEIKILDDNSIFARILHHNNQSGAVFFTADNVMNIQEENLYSRLYLLEEFRDEDNSFEFLVIQSEFDDIYRWKQSNNPTNTTTVTDFVEIENMTNGLVHCSGNTLIAYGTTTSNWWGAIGAYRSSQNGVPGFGNHIVTEDLDFFVRIDNLPNKQQTKIYDNYIVCTDIYEI